MKRQRVIGFRVVPAIVVAVTLVLAVPSQVLAANAVSLQSNADHSLGARESLMRIAAEYKKITATNRFGPGIESLLNQVTVQLASMSDEESVLAAQRFGPLIDRMTYDLAVLEHALPVAGPGGGGGNLAGEFPGADYPAVDLADFLITISSTNLPNLDDLLALINPLNGGGTPGIPQIPNSLIPGKCIADPDGDGVPTRVPDSELLYARMGLQGLELTNAIAKDICGQDLGALGFSGNLSVVCILFDVAYMIPRFVYDNVTLCEGFTDGAEATASYARLGYLHEEMGEVKTGIAGLGAEIASGFDTVNGKLDTVIAKADLILSQLDAQRIFLVGFRNLTVRMAIEENLTGNGNAKVSLFQLPGVHGGYLEVVRQIVLETIQKTVAAGQPVFNAQKEFDRANLAFQQGSYKTAFDQYRKAYTEAVK
jgi:hypothetical protein